MTDSKEKFAIKLSELLQGITSVPTEKDTVITGLSEYSGDVTHGDVYFATTNLTYCQEAIKNGASAIIYDEKLVSSLGNIEATIPMIACNQLMQKIKELSVLFYGSISEDIKTIAITGTDGKSSVAHLSTQAVENCGDTCGIIGTLGYGRLSALKEATHTTPPRSRIAKEYSLLANAGCNTVAIEASSHGIQQQRLRDVPIHTAVLTNISRDHLDYHKTVEEYIQAKAQLFFDHHPKYVVINMDDDIGKKWILQLAESTNVLSFSLHDEQADIFAANVNYTRDGIDLAISVRDQLINIFVPMYGEFNVSNVLAVSAILVSLGKSNDEILFALNNLTAVPGRMQLVASNHGARVIIDYAHTPAALLAAINAVRKHDSGRLICVFGCGGDRDTGKRPLMGEIATQHADIAVITSDNPRSEDPQLIIDEILNGSVKENKPNSFVDRKEAIAYALSLAQENDSVLIAGKGHEKFQEISGCKYPFDDVEVAEQEISRRSNG